MQDEAPASSAAVREVRRMRCLFGVRVNGNGVAVFMVMIGFKRLTGSAAGLAGKFSEFLKNKIPRRGRRNACC